MEKVILLPSYYKKESYSNVKQLIDSLKYFDESYGVMVHLQNYPQSYVDELKSIVENNGQSDRVIVVNIEKDIADPASFTNRNIRNKTYNLADQHIIGPYYLNHEHRESVRHHTVLIHIDDDFLFTENSQKYYDRAHELVMNPETHVAIVKVNNRKKNYNEEAYMDEFLWTSAGIVHFDIGHIFDDEVLDMKMGGDDLAIYAHAIRYGAHFSCINGADILNSPDFSYESSGNNYDDPSDQWRMDDSHEIFEHYQKELGLPASKMYSVSAHEKIQINLINKYIGKLPFIDPLKEGLIVSE